jgi:hypothetical protein
MDAEQSKSNQIPPSSAFSAGHPSFSSQIISTQFPTCDRPHWKLQRFRVMFQKPIPVATNPGTAPRNPKFPNFCLDLPTMPSM